jgi:hypothetical protein
MSLGNKVGRVWWAAYFAVSRDNVTDTEEEENNSNSTVTVRRHLVLRLLQTVTDYKPTQ